DPAAVPPIRSWTSARPATTSPATRPSSPLTPPCASRSARPQARRCTSSAPSTPGCRDASRCADPPAFADRVHTGVMNELEELHLHRVLVAIDGSESAELALRAAVTVARQDHAAISLLVVIPDVFAQITRWPVPGSTDPAALQDQVEREAAELLRTTVER